MGPLFYDQSAGKHVKKGLKRGHHLLGWGPRLHDDHDHHDHHDDHDHDHDHIGYML